MSSNRPRHKAPSPDPPQGSGGGVAVPEHEPMAVDRRAPDVFPMVHEIPSIAILEALWVDGVLRLRIDPRDGDPIVLALPPVAIRGFKQFLEQMEKTKP